jgi:hypothetical protein
MNAATIRQGALTTLGVLAVCLALGSAWRLDAQAEPTPFRTPEQLNGALTEARQAEAAYRRALRNAQEECRAERGPDALMWMTPEGFMVCRRNTSRGAV